MRIGSPAGGSKGAPGRPVGGCRCTGSVAELRDSRRPAAEHGPPGARVDLAFSPRRLRPRRAPGRARAGRVRLEWAARQPGGEEIGRYLAALAGYDIVPAAPLEDSEVLASLRGLVGPEVMALAHARALEQRGKVGR